MQVDLFAYFTHWPFWPAAKVCLMALLKVTIYLSRLKFSCLSYGIVLFVKTISLFFSGKTVRSLVL